MIFTSAVSLILALAPATILAAPTQPADSIANLFTRQNLPKIMLEHLIKTEGLCDLSKVQMLPAPTPLPPVSPGLSIRLIAIGRGTQNYTCDSASKDVVPKANGAIASLFNATCDSARMNNKVMADVTALALNYQVPTGNEANIRLVGHHEFTDKKIPFFNLKTDLVDYGSALAGADIIKSAAPEESSKGTNGLGSVPWLKLSITEGNYKEVYRIHTAGGVAPKTCEGVQGGFTVQYSAEYWFYA